MLSPGPVPKPPSRMRSSPLGRNLNALLAWLMLSLITQRMALHFLNAGPHGQCLVQKLLQGSRRFDEVERGQAVGEHDDGVGGQAKQIGQLVGGPG